MKKILIAFLVLLCVSNSINCMEVKDEHKDFISSLKQTALIYLEGTIQDRYKDLSKEELNKRLTDLLNLKGNRMDLDESVRLIIAGADIDVKSENGWTTLIAAAQRGRTEVIGLLVDKGANINAQDNDGWSALIWATEVGRNEAVRVLIDKGADIEIKDKFGWTPLMFAVSKGRTEMVKFLIDKGANIDNQDNFDRTALMVAKKIDHIEIMQLLSKKD